MDGNHHTDLFIDNAFPEPSLSITAALMHPDDVMNTPQLSRAQKQEILASWASDARAVQDMPALRQLDNGAIVRVDDVLRALSALDDDVSCSQHASAPIRPSVQRRRRGPISWRDIALRGRSKDDDDDDPPPCPAVLSALAPASAV